MVIEQAILIALTVVTSLGAYAVGVRRLRLSPRRLGASVLVVFQLVGMSAVFFAVNLALGLAGILALRSVTERFLSVYLLNDVTLGGLSVLQGVLFECWRATGRGPHDG